MLKMKCHAFNEMKADRTAARSVKDPMEEARRVAVERYGPQTYSPEAVFPARKHVRACKKLMDHVCDARLSNLLSKIGNDPIANGEIDDVKLAHMLAADALKDFVKDEDAEVVNLPLILRREMTRFCLVEAKKLVTKQWKTLVQNATKTSD